jgi:thioesterase domain-containing protein
VELAAIYAREIRQVVGRGPCTLAGNCLGGILALETARRLSDAGIEVAPPVLIDTAFPSAILRRATGHAAALLFGQRSRSPSREELPATRGALARHMAGWLARKLRRRGTVWVWRAFRAAGIEPPGRLNDASAMLAVAGARYRTRPGDDRAVLICIDRISNQRGWEGVARAGLETVVIPARSAAPRADHVIAEAYTEDLARVLRDR